MFSHKGTLLFRAPVLQFQELSIVRHDPSKVCSTQCKDSSGKTAKLSLALRELAPSLPSLLSFGGARHLYWSQALPVGFLQRELSPEIALPLFLSFLWTSLEILYPEMKHGYLQFLNHDKEKRKINSVRSPLQAEPACSFLVSSPNPYWSSGVQ